MIKEIGMIYLLIMNLVAFCMFGIDKKNAQWRGKRIPESTLMLVSLLGGSVGAYAGMRVFRHKTRQVKFFLGIPAIIVLQVLIVFGITNIL